MAESGPSDQFLKQREVVNRNEASPRRQGWSALGVTRAGWSIATEVNIICLIGLCIDCEGKEAVDALLMRISG
jgi:hypothetical protein